MNTAVKTVRLTRELFDIFMTRFYFAEQRMDPNYGEVYFHENSFSYAILDDNDEIIGAFGMCMPWKGVGEVWLMATDFLHDHKLWLIKTLRSVTDLALVKGCHRVQMFVVAEDKVACKFAKVLGFTYEGRLKKHSATGEDHAVFAKT